jgi:serine/threonine protein kinase
MGRLTSIHSRRSALALRTAFWATECGDEPGKLHQRGLVRKDIKPANILVKRATGTVKLTASGIASRLRCERQSPEPSETTADTLSGCLRERAIRRTRRMPSRTRANSLAIRHEVPAWQCKRPVDFGLFADANSVSAVPGLCQAGTRELRPMPPRVLGRTMRLLIASTRTRL